jgi:hypothetical protein
MAMIERTPPRWDDLRDHLGPDDPDPAEQARMKEDDLDFAANRSHYAARDREEAAARATGPRPPRRR